ncbi:hypothetical protein CGLO_15979 [Colletotrichum gloeosporioides Cg-14]|uniref:Uncharacterized protein n=1 Tax=Colletotrichum gloeosporioides (strain Cg-14) TaxID=1237896 RepID=T0L0U8_COLGC|nr:hypothetical protein CGLO_15979 [Colletotrichum gloeosporioides Cg-14]
MKMKLIHLKNLRIFEGYGAMRSALIITD